LQGGRVAIGLILLICCRERLEVNLNLVIYEVRQWPSFPGSKEARAMRVKVVTIRNRWVVLRHEQKEERRVRWTSRRLRGTASCLAIYIVCYWTEEERKPEPT